MIARLSNGASISVVFGAGRPIPPFDQARPEDREPGRRILGEVMKGLLAEAYHDQAGPFVRVLLECVNTYTPEKHPRVKANTRGRPGPAPRPLRSR